MLFVNVFCFLALSLIQIRADCVLPDPKESGLILKSTPPVNGKIKEGEIATFLCSKEKLTSSLKCVEGIFMTDKSKWVDMNSVCNAHCKLPKHTSVNIECAMWLFDNKICEPKCDDVSLGHFQCHKISGLLKNVTGKWEKYTEKQIKDDEALCSKSKSGIPVKPLSTSEPEPTKAIQPVPKEGVTSLPTPIPPPPPPPPPPQFATQPVPKANENPLPTRPPPPPPPSEQATQSVPSNPSSAQDASPVVTDGKKEKKVLKSENRHEKNLADSTVSTKITPDSTVTDQAAQEATANKDLTTVGNTPTPGPTVTDQAAQGATANKNLTTVGNTPTPGPTVTDQAAQDATSNKDATMKDVETKPKTCAQAAEELKFPQATIISCTGDSCTYKCEKGTVLSVDGKLKKTAGKLSKEIVCKDAVFDQPSCDSPGSICGNAGKPNPKDGEVVACDSNDLSCYYSCLPNNKPSTTIKKIKGVSLGQITCEMGGKWKEAECVPIPPEELVTPTTNNETSTPPPPVAEAVIPKKPEEKAKIIKKPPPEAGTETPVKAPKPAPEAGTENPVKELKPAPAAGTETPVKAPKPAPAAGTETPVKAPKPEPVKNQTKDSDKPKDTAKSTPNNENPATANSNGGVFESIKNTLNRVMGTKKEEKSV